MTDTPNDRWTLDGLSDRVAAALAIDYQGQPSDRVSEIPSARVIRYYASLGLVDRPAAMRGRTALYGRRHLLQIVAIKRLQAAGHSLAQIQAQLTGLPDARLEPIARLPAAIAAASPPPQAARAARPFWRQVPRPEPGPKGESLPPVQSLQGIQLAGGTTLLLETGRTLSPADLQAIQQAAGPLIRQLAAMGMIQTTSEGRPR